MYRFLILFLIVGNIILANQNRRNFEFILEKDNLDRFKVLITDNSTERYEINQYIIQKDDTLSELSVKLKNPIGVLIELNKIKNKDLIYENEVLSYYKDEENENK